MPNSPNLIRMRELLEQLSGPQASEDTLVMIAIKLIEALPDALIIADASGKIVLANAQSEWMFGCTRAGILGKHVEDFMPERYRTNHEHYRTEYLDRPYMREMGVGRDLFITHKDGREIAVEIMLSPMMTADGTLILAILRRKHITSS